MNCSESWNFELTIWFNVDFTVDCLHNDRSILMYILNDLLIFWGFYLRCCRDAFYLNKKDNVKQTVQIQWSSYTKDLNKTVNCLVVAELPLHISVNISMFIYKGFIWLYVCARYVINKFIHTWKKVYGLINLHWKNNTRKV